MSIIEDVRNWLVSQYYSKREHISVSRGATDKNRPVIVGAAGTLDTTLIPANAIDNTRLADMAQATIKGRAAAAGTGDPTDLTAAQVIVILLAADGTGSLLDADFLDGLDSTAFAILAGQAAGQTLNGSTAASGNLTLSSTANATKGKILFGSSAYDEANDRIGAGTASPAYTLEVVKSVADYVSKIRNTNGTSAGNGLWVDTRWNVATNVALRVTTNQGAVELLSCMGDGKIGLGTASPTALLDVPASAAGNASLRVRSGTAPTSPNDGDIWYDGTNIKMRVGATTKTFTLV